LIEVVDYDAAWPQRFERLRAALWPAVLDVAIAIEHVGSTSVSGLAAKPVIDLDIIVVDVPSQRAAIASLAKLGYVHRGDLGVTGREAFTTPDSASRHNLYVCLDGCVSLRNHLVIRDYLRAHRETAVEYGNLKRWLAQRFPDDIDAYIAGKTDLLCRILTLSGMPAEEIAAIRGVNACCEVLAPSQNPGSQSRPSLARSLL
jgi:GrpB-like predicted nucleotidyltransferase (UPF0157 family)